MLSPMAPLMARIRFMFFPNWALWDRARIFTCRPSRNPRVTRSHRSRVASSVTRAVAADRKRSSCSASAVSSMTAETR